jgi:hypothetical protein
MSTVTDAGEGAVTHMSAVNLRQKFDLQLEQAQLRERALDKIFADARIEKIELKSESHQWEQTGNICMEFKQDGKPSGIATTEADFWVHELLRGGDGGRFCNIIIPLREILK